MLPLKGEFVILMSIVNVAVMAIVRHDLHPLEKSNSDLRASTFLHTFTRVPHRVQSFRHEGTQD